MRFLKGLVLLLDLFVKSFELFSLVFETLDEPFLLFFLPFSFLELSLLLLFSFFIGLSLFFDLYCIIFLSSEEIRDDQSKSIVFRLLVELTFVILLDELDRLPEPWDVLLNEVCLCCVEPYAHLIH